MAYSIFAMKKLALFVISLVALLLCGCGGGGGVNPYAGAWSGTYNEPSTPDNGTISFTVATNGDVSGTATSAVDSTAVTLIGHVDGSGHMTGTINNGVDVAAVTGTFVLSGSNTINSTGLIGGVVGWSFTVNKL